MAILHDAALHDASVYASTLQIHHRRLVFRYSASNGHYAIWELTVPTTYTGTTGLTLVFNWYNQIGCGSGNVVWEFAASALTAQTTANLVTLDAWGTPTVASGQAISAVNGQIFTQTINLVKANVGNHAPVIGDLLRVRLRRLSSTSGVANTNDGFKDSAIVVGSIDLQGY